MNKETIEDLTLVLMYLNSWEEKNEFVAEKDCKTWKSYNYNDLNSLDSKELISIGNRPYKSKIAYLTKEGIEKAKEFIKKYHIE